MFRKENTSMVVIEISMASEIKRIERAPSNMIVVLNQTRTDTKHLAVGG